MRSLGFRLVFCTLAAVVWGSNTARADWWSYTETAYTVPASAAFALPTTYIVPSSYIVPTSAVIPTVYATAYYPTSYTWTPTAYYPTSYVPTGYYVSERVARRPLLSRVFGRRRDYFVPTTIYYPTSTVVPTTARYYAPTILEYPVISSTQYRSVADACCTYDDSVVVASAPASIERRVVRDEESAPRAERPRTRSRVESDSIEEQDTTSSNVQPVSPELEPVPMERNAIPPVELNRTPPDNTANSNTPAPAGKDSPPTSPAATPTPSSAGAIRNSAPLRTEPSQNKTGSGTQSNPPEKKAEEPARIERDPSETPINLPIAPGSGADDKNALPPNLDGKSAPGTTRESLKPSSYEFSRRPALSLLKGRVRSSVDSEPEDGVRVTLSSRTNAFEDRTAYSNEAGRFALNVPDGDWTVKVTMPSGRVYPVYRITVSGGAIIDDKGRDIPALIITR